MAGLFLKFIGFNVVLGLLQLWMVVMLHYYRKDSLGMLHRVGLLSKGNKELVRFAWAMYRRKVDDPLPATFKETFCRSVSVHFLGVWDTVSSVGWAWNPSYLEFTRFNASVEVLRHAIALD